MTRAEAAAQEAKEATAGNSDDMVPIAKKPASKPAPKADKQTASASSAAQSPVTVSIATYAPLAEDLKPISAKAEAPARSRVPAVPQVSTGVTASIPSKAAVPAVSAPAKTSNASKKHNTVSAAMTLDANPVDTGTRAPAVPAVL